jgi:hypothetical protein
MPDHWLRFDDLCHEIVFFTHEGIYFRMSEDIKAIKGLAIMVNS